MNNNNEVVYDECFELKIPFKKVQQVIFMSESELLVLFQYEEYCLVAIQSKEECKILKEGRVNGMIEEVSRISSEQIIFIRGNQLIIFHPIQEEQIAKVTIPGSLVHIDQYHYSLNLTQQIPFILFYKSTILKSNPPIVYYDLHLSSYSFSDQTIHKIKKAKAEYQGIRQFRYACGEILSYQVSGYTIEVMFFESGALQKIHSIYNIFLIDLQIRKDEILMKFSHQQMQNELVVYSINQKRIKKLQRTLRINSFNEIHSPSCNRVIHHKNLFVNEEKNDEYILKLHFGKKTKYLSLLGHVDQTLSVQFTNDILFLLD